MDGDLFRQQALHYRIGQDQGKPKLIVPPGSRLLTLLLVSLLVAAGSFLVNGSYARKATVAGIIESSDAIKRIYPPRTGVLEALILTTGDTVKKGEPIARFAPILPMSPAARAGLVIEYEGQLEAINARLASVERESIAERSRITADQQNLVSTINYQRRITLLQTEKVIHLEQIRSAAEPLYESGKLSRLEWGQFNESLLAGRQRLEQLHADQESRETELRKLGVTLAQLPATYSGQVAALEQEQSAIRQQIGQLSAESTFVLFSPVNGTITEVLVQRGQTAGIDQPVALIRPSTATLRARLMIPPASAGFVARGQRVNLLFDAFPYQQFGSYPGTIARLSHQALMPGDKKAGQREPYFEARVTLARDWVTAYGSPVPLRDGMTLKADIVLDERSLMDWLLEPLYVMRGRAS